MTSIAASRYVKRLAVALALILASDVAGSFAQEKYPNRPITIVAPFPPGGVAAHVAVLHLDHS